MRAGRLKSLIEIQRYTTTKNMVGEVKQSWNTLLNTRAEIKPLTAKEIFASNMNVSEVTHKITIRYEVEIKSTDRIVYNGRFFDITGVINIDEQNTVIEILTKENNIQG